MIIATQVDSHGPGQLYGVRGFGSVTIINKSPEDLENPHRENHFDIFMVDSDDFRPKNWVGEMAYWNDTIWEIMGVRIDKLMMDYQRLSFRNRNPEVYYDISIFRMTF